MRKFIKDEWYYNKKNFLLMSFLVLCILTRLFIFVAFMPDKTGTLLLLSQLGLVCVVSLNTMKEAKYDKFLQHFYVINYAVFYFISDCRVPTPAMFLDIFIVLAISSVYSEYKTIIMAYVYGIVYLILGSKLVGPRMTPIEANDILLYAITVIVYTTTAMTLLIQCYFSKKANEEVVSKSKEIEKEKEKMQKILDNIQFNSNALHDVKELLLSNIKSTEESTNTIHSAIQTINVNLESQTEGINFSAKNIAEQSQEIQVVTNVSEDVKSLSVESYNCSLDGAGYVEDLVDKIMIIDDFYKIAKNEMDILMERTKEIDQILVKIEEVSNQTNMLSLNASIEAARCGEMGKGFGVIAVEIKKLSELSRSSTNDIFSITSKLSDVVERLSHALNDSDDSIESSLKSSENVRNIFEKIKMASYNAQNKSKELDDKIAHVNSNTEHISVEIQSILANSEEEVSCMQEISSNIDTQQQELKVLTDGFNELSLVVDSLSECLKGSMK